MRLDSLLHSHGHTRWGALAPRDFEIKDLVFDSRKVNSTCLFFAIKGVNSDGHNFLADVIAAGVKALVVEDTKNIPKDFQGTVHVVLNSRWTMHEVAEVFYSSPGDQLLSIAITGTNGKTSTTYIIEHILNKNGLVCGVIGTINHHLMEKVWPSALTTPDDLNLQIRLKEFFEAGAKAFAIEASSHALHQQRLLQKFDIAIFTNLTRDHLDYHKNMDEYFAAKELLFKNHFKDKPDVFAIVNADDIYADKLQIDSKATVLKYGKKECDFQILDLKQSIEKLTFKIKHKNDLYNFESPLLGEHNAYNLTAGIVVAMTQGISPRSIALALKDFCQIPGRMERVKNQNKNLHNFVDYSHTPDALEKALLTLNEVKPETADIYCVFGCGGDRDKGKRPMMAAIAEKLSQCVVVTSDNPRSENPQSIIDDIAVGFKNKSKVKTEIDRKKAIHLAMRMSKPGDIILVAGKGHEAYQIIGSQTLDFSDQEVIREFKS